MSETRAPDAPETDEPVVTAQTEAAADTPVAEGAGSPAAEVTGSTSVETFSVPEPAGQAAALAEGPAGSAPPEPVADAPEVSSVGAAPVEPGAEAPAEPLEPAVPAEPSQDEFAQMLEAAGEPERTRRKRGDKVKAKVVRVTDEWVFVALGGKEEGSVRRAEFGTGDDAKVPGEGDEIEAYVLSMDAGQVALTTQLSQKDASKAALEAAWKNEIPVEGKVVKAIKGGLEVRVSGLRAFCPLSQIDLRWPKEPEIYVGQTFSFRILEYKNNGRNVVVSRRVLIEAERAEKREALKETVVPGAVISGGVIRSVHDFGAFVDLGGADALIPVSEIRWSRVEKAADVLTPGQEVTAKVLSVDWEKDRISLSLKALEEDPWQAAAAKFAPGQRIPGTVVRLAPFGAFVRVADGVDGLVHISALGAGRRVKHPNEVVQVGEQVEVEVKSVDLAARKISLSLEHRLTDALGDLPKKGQVVEGTVEKVADFGVFVKVPSGHTGLVPNVEMGTPRGTDHARMFKPGDAMEVMVLEVQQGGKRIRLSRKAIGEAEEREARRAYQESQADTGGFGTLGDLLKGKFGK